MVISPFMYMTLVPQNAGPLHLESSTSFVQLLVMRLTKAKNSLLWFHGSIIRLLCTFHHVTFDIVNLSLHAKYDSPDKIMVGDGKTLPIFDLGSAHLSSPSKSFVLSDVCPYYDHKLAFCF